VQAAGLWEVTASCGSSQANFLRLQVEVPQDADVSSVQFRVFSPGTAIAQLAEVSAAAGSAASVSYPADFAGAPALVAGVYIIEIRADILVNFPTSVGTGTAIAR
jgi:hypothetical protein